MSDQGIITTFSPLTGAITCSAYHLTAFAIEEYDPLVSTSTMPPILDKVIVFKPLDLSTTTAYFVIFGLCLALGFLVM